MDENLRRAALEGNVSDLYRLIKRDGNVLKRIGEVEFIDTPLHIAAAAGCIDFAMEIMSLKPSFARVLNQEGLSPIHLAVEKGYKELVLLLLENNKDLVRVKGKNGETPLHYAVTREHNLDLLAKFLEACPECIRDVTTTNQTALHIATRNNELEALKLLCRMLRRTDYREDVVNQKDRNGDTVLHITARNNRHEMLKLLLKCKADKHATNLDGSTALDVAQRRKNKESIRILRSCFIPRVSTFIEKLQKQYSKYVRKASAIIFHDMDNISIEGRNALLVILGLLLTATYQASLSPPGSVWQGDNSSNTTASLSPPGRVYYKDNSSSFRPPGSVRQGHNSSNSTPQPGKSVMNQTNFLLFYIPTCAVFIVTFFLTLGLLKPFPSGFRTALQILLAFLAVCFYQAIFFLAPTPSATLVINLFSVLLVVLMMFMCCAYRVSKLSVLIIGWWLCPASQLGHGYLVVTIFVGCLLIPFLHEFWKGTALIGYYLLFVYNYQIMGTRIAIFVVGCWLFLNLCRVCIKWCNRHL